MTAIQLEAPAQEPVGLADAKAHLRLETDTEDDLIAAMLVAARSHVEALTGCLMMRQTWRIYGDRWPANGRFDLPLGPILSVDSLSVIDAAGAPQALPASAYDVDTASRPARIRLRNAAVILPGRALNGIEIDVTAGYGATTLDVPAALRQAILMLVANWFDHRGPGIDPEGLPGPDGLSALVAPFREVRL